MWVWEEDLVPFVEQVTWTCSRQRKCSILCHENGSSMKDKLLICSWHGMITLFGLKGSLHAKLARNIVVALLCAAAAAKRRAVKIVSKLKKWIVRGSKALTNGCFSFHSGISKNGFARTMQQANIPMLLL